MLAEIIAGLNAATIFGYLQDAWFILLVLIGFSVIIFVHELGHFVMAKLMGIRVDTFAIGFGPRIFGFKRGDTDYCLRILPLGGYVKMMGQEDFALDHDRVEATKIDPQSFLAKTPGQRALVVSGGVVMNVIFAAIAFIVVFTHGLDFYAPVIGSVAPDSPAAQAGILSGDKVIAADGQDVYHFGEFQLAILTSDPVKGVNLTIDRDGEIIRTHVLPAENRRQELLQIGISSAGSLTVVDPGMAGPDDEQLQANDRIVGIDSIQPRYFDDVRQAIVNAAGEPVELTVERTINQEARQVKVLKRAHLILYPEIKADSDQITSRELSEIPQENVSILGLVPRRKFIATPEPPAQADRDQYVQAGDIVVRVGNIAHPTWKEIRDYLSDQRRQDVTLEALRDGDRRQVKIYVPFAETRFEYLMGHLGFDDLNPIVSATIKSSVGDPADIPRGAKILACDDQSINTWFDLIACFKAHPGQPVTLRYEYGDQEQTATIAVPQDDPWQGRLDYAVDFFTEPVMTTVKAENAYHALTLGLRQTGYTIKTVYVTLQRVAFTRTIGVKQLSGPIYIVHHGKEVARAGFYKLLYYMALISANLAVINFLPLPVVDGGLMLILGAEKLRGKPLSARFTAIWQGVGLVLILSLFLFVIYNDILKIFQGI